MFKDIDFQMNHQREDRVASAGLEAIMREYAFELAKAPKPSETPAPPTRTTEDKDKEAVKKDKDLIIRSKDTVSKLEIRWM